MATGDFLGVAGGDGGKTNGTFNRDPFLPMVGNEIGNNRFEIGDRCCSRLMFGNVCS